MLDVAVAADLKAGFGTTMVEMDPVAMKEVANSTMALPGVSDGGAHTKFITTGRYATEMLAHWVRECEIMSLEDAHWRLSAYPAMAVGLKDRGFLAEGKPADVIVYDPDTVDCLDQERLFDYPADEWRLVQKAKGYDRIIVNGVTTFIDGVCTDATPGPAAAARDGLSDERRRGANHDERQRGDSLDLRRRQPLLGDERRVHPTSRREVRRPRRDADRHRRQGAVHVRRAAAPDHPGAGRRAPAAAPRRTPRLLRGPELQGARRQRARVRGAVGAPGVVRPRRPPGVHGRAGRRGGLVVPVAGRLHGGPHAARHRGVDPHPARVQPVARRRLGLRVPGPHLRGAVPHDLRRRPGGRGAGVVPRPRRARRLHSQRAGVHARGHEVARRSDVRPVLGARRRSGGGHGAARGLRGRLHARVRRARRGVGPFRATRRRDR